MGTLNHRDLEDVLDVTRQVFQFKETDDLRRNVLSLLDPLFKTNRGNFFLASDVEQHLNLETIVSTGIEDKFLAQFREHYYKWDPFLTSLFSFDTDVYTTEQVVPYGGLRKTKYYNEFLKPQSIHSQLVMYLRSGARLLGVIALFRPPQQEVFSEDDRLKARMMTSCLTAALEKTIVSDQMAQWEVIINSIASEVPRKGIIILNDHLEKVYANETAEGILSILPEDREGKAMAGRLPAHLRQHCQALMRSVTAEGAPTKQKEQFNLALKGTGRDLTVQMRIVNGPQKKPFFLVFFEPGEHTATMNERLGAMGLTKREMEVALLVCKGLSNAAISCTLFISEYTVWNHLRSIFEKAGVKNRTSLAHLMSGI